MTRQIDSRKIIDMVTPAFKYQMQLPDGPGQEAWLDERGLGLGGKLRGIANVLGKPSPCWRQRVPTEERIRVGSLQTPPDVLILSEVSGA
jgi:hypothetical protein